MQFSVSDAKGQLTDLVRRAEAGEDVVLTRHGNAVVRLVAIRAKPDRSSKRALLDAMRRSAAARHTSGANAERSQDFLYDAEGMPGDASGLTK